MHNTAFIAVMRRAAPSGLGRAAFLAAVLALCGGGAVAARVASVSPEGEVAEVRQVQVRFDAAVVPAGDPRAPAPFTLACHARVPAAQARWLNERSWVLDFDTPLAAGRGRALQAHAEPGLPAAGRGARRPA